MFLILPTHRKYIKLLRERANSGNTVVTTKEDWEDFRELVRKTKHRLPHHQVLYRIALRAMNRPLEEVEPEDIYAVLDKRVITVIENTLGKAEWKSLGATLTGAYIIPLLQSLVKKLEKKQKKEYGMAEDEWRLYNFQEVVTFVERNKRNPSRYDAEERGEVFEMVEA